MELESPEKAAEFLRLTLAKLSDLKLPVTAINYALIYNYVAGSNVTLNERIDADIAQGVEFDHELVKEYFARYVCQCDAADDEALKLELLNAVAQILGSIIDFAGQAALSNASLERHLEQLASSSDPKEILRIAATIISETRGFVDATQVFEYTMRDTTVQIESLKEELDQARQEAAKDTLTGLYNRRGFDTALQETIESFEEVGTTFCLLMLDIDYFKRVNDAHGHLVGDKVLKGVSNLLIKNMRGNDYLCRFGGEEFAVILRATPITGAFTVAEHLRASVEKLKLKHVKTGKSLEQITISIGVACYRNGEQAVDLIARCDKALYRAKELGRNRTVIAD